MDESHIPLLDKCPSKTSGHNDTLSECTKNPIKLDFRFKRCSTGKYCRTDRCGGNGYRHSNSLGQICKHLANNNVDLRRTKSSTGICERPGKLRELFKGAGKNTTTQRITVNNDDGMAASAAAAGIKKKGLKERHANRGTDSNDSTVDAVRLGNENGDGGKGNGSPIDVGVEEAMAMTVEKQQRNYSEPASLESPTGFSLVVNSDNRNHAIKHDGTIIENSPIHLKKTKKKNTNPFLEHEASEMECADTKSMASKKIGREENAMENAGETDTNKQSRQSRQSQQHQWPPVQSNDAEEPISVMFNNDDTISIDESVCKSNWINDSECHWTELFNNKSCNSLHLTPNDLGGRGAMAATLNGTGTMAIGTSGKQRGCKFRRHKEAMDKDWSHIRSTGNLLSSSDGYQHRPSDRSSTSSDKRHNYHYRHVRPLPNGPNGPNTKVDQYGGSWAQEPKANLANDDHTKNTMPDNYVNEFGERISGDEGKTAVPSMVYPRGSSKNTNPVGDIPTCPFQRQDYTKPDDEFQMDYNFIDKANKKSKRDKKDIFGFGVPKGKGAVAGGVVGSGPAATSVDVAASVCSVAPASSVGHAQKVPHLKKLNISYPNKTQLGDDVQQKEDKKYFDKTKKSLIKIGQKCGLRLNRSPEKRYTLQPSLSHRAAKADAKDSRFSESNGYVVQRVQYKSYRSELDLTRNLHHLDAFLNDNFDKINKPLGSQSIGKVSRRKHHALPYGHKRAKSFSKNTETELSSVEYGTAAEEMVGPYAEPFAVQDGCSAGNTVVPVQPRKPVSIKSRLATDTQYPPGVSSSDSFSTYNSKPLNRKDNIPLPNKEQSSSGNDKSAKSNTTSSSLSSSDYASVYSPSSSTQTGEYNNRFSSFSSTSNALADVPIYDSGLGHATDLSSVTQRGRLKSYNTYDRRTRSSYSSDIYDDHVPIPVPIQNGPLLAHSLHDDDHLRLLDTSLYQYENKLPYHEDYLHHYYNNLSEQHVMAIESNPDLSVVVDADQRHDSHRGPRGSKTNQFNYIQEKSIRSNQKYPPQRIHMSSKTKPYTSDVVLEYEC